jgi:HK97 family phage major capsid protein
MAATINTIEEFRAHVLKELPSILAENPQVVLDAMAKNPEAMRASLTKMGYIVSDDVKTIASETMTTLRDRQETGSIASGFGTRTREKVRMHARRVLDEDTGKQRTTYLDAETEPLAGQWIRAFFASKGGGEAKDPVTGDHIGVIAERMAKATRAPATPMTAEAGTGGGFLVPLLVAAEVFEYMNERFLLRGMVQVFVSAAPLTIPRRLSQVSVYRQGPGTDLTEVNIASTLGDAKLSPERVGAITYVDPALALAAAVGPVRWVIGQLAEALAKDYQRTIVIGSASKREPRGILGLATSGLPLADMAQTSTYDNTSNQTKRDSIRKLYYKVNQPHRESPRFVWITNNDGVQTMNSVNDLNQQPFTDAKEGQPPKYIGKTVVETLAIVSATGPESTTLVGGDMGQYAWLESPDGLTMQQTTEGGQAWSSDTIGIKILQRVDGEPVIPQAFCSMTGVN